jgi:hypothetical protein
VRGGIFQGKFRLKPVVSNCSYCGTAAGGNPSGTYPAEAAPAAPFPNEQAEIEKFPHDR